MDSLLPDILVAGLPGQAGPPAAADSIRSRRGRWSMIGCIPFAGSCGYPSAAP